MTEGRAAGTVLDREVVRPAEPELQAIRQIADFITQIGMEEPTQRPALLGPKGEKILLPDSLYRVLCQVLEHLGRGESVSIMHTAEELTTQQAAELLNVSRPYLVRLLDRGDIPCRMVGTHRRILREDLEQYRAERDKKRRHHLRAMVQDADELGLYEAAQLSSAELVEVETH